MKIIRDSKQWKKKIPLAVGLGNFDGVHLGHRAILENLIKTAKKEKVPSCVYTFDPHPAKILSPKTAPALIQTVKQKLKSLEELGIDITILEKFDTRFSKQSPHDFFKKILVNKLHAIELWTGYDFTFGVKRSGNVDLLKKFCKEENIKLHVVHPQFANGTLVSSTQIRSLVAGGEVRLAWDLMGKPFALTGTVEKGHGIGGEMGIHTANLKFENELLPKRGIYITKTRVGLGTTDYGLRTKSKRGVKYWPSATSVGVNPTFPGKGFSVETHLIGFEGNLVGKRIEVEFCEWLREEYQFPNTETLATQIKKDIAEAKKFHETLRHHR